MATSSSLGPTTATGSNPNFRTNPEKYAAIDDLLTGAQAVNKPVVRELLVKSFGDQGITGFLKLTGAVKNAGAADQVEYYEEGRRHRTFTGTAGTGTASAGGSIPLDVGADDTADPAVNKLVQTNDVIMNVNTGVRFIVTDDLRDTEYGGTADDDVVNIARLDGGAIANDSNSYTASTDETYVVLGNMYGQGTSQPQHFMQPDVVRQKNPFMIIKDR